MTLWIPNVCAGAGSTGADGCLIHVNDKNSNRREFQRFCEIHKAMFDSGVSEKDILAEIFADEDVWSAAIQALKMKAPDVPMSIEFSRYRSLEIRIFDKNSGRPSNDVILKANLAAVAAEALKLNGKQVGLDRIAVL